MQKYKITFGEDTIPDEEILQWQNFDQVLKKHELATVKAGYQAYFWKGMVLISAVMLLSAGYYFYNKNTKPSPQPTIVLGIPEEATAPDVQPPSQQAIVNAEADQAPDDTASKPVLQKPAKANIATPSTSPTEPIAAITPNEITTASSSAEAPLSYIDEERKEVVFTEAIPVDGYPALYRYFRTHLQFPEDATFNQISGTVIVGFSINKNGKPSNIQVIEGVNKSIDREAIRLIEQMPVWVPAMVNDIPITTRLVIPITFQLTHLEKKPLQRP